MNSRLGWAKPAQICPRFIKFIQRRYGIRAAVVRVFIQKSLNTQRIKPAPLALHWADLSNFGEGEEHGNLLCVKAMLHACFF